MPKIVNILELPTKAWSILEDSLTYRRALLRHSDLGLRVWGTLRTAELCAMAYER